ncbi:MAG: hypothetical protein VW268_03225 [Rhodospirillaceae bacterium]
MTRSIRQGNMGHNPFVPLILMVAPDEDTNAIKAALNAEVDDVVPKPISRARATNTSPGFAVR